MHFRGTRLGALITVCSATLAVAVPAAAQATFSGFNGPIAFGARSGDASDVFSMDPDGSGLRRLTTDPLYETDPAYSPDAQQIAFTNASDGISVMNADGSGEVRLTSGTRDSHPAWSPDGQRIVFQSARDAGNAEIYVMNADGSGQTRLTNAITSDTTPSWSPDGQRIAFSKAPRNTLDYVVQLMNTDGSDVTALTPGSHPDWSPDGQSLVYTEGIVEQAEIAVIGADGTGKRRLTLDNLRDLFPGWSPDGQKVLFQRTFGVGTPQLFAINVDGTGLTWMGVDGSTTSSWGVSPRLGYFSCRASALRSANGEPEVASAPTVPCADARGPGEPTVLGQSPLTLTLGPLSARTDVRPDHPATTVPSATDGAVSDAAAGAITIELGPITITASGMQAHASVACGAPTAAPALASSSTVSSLRVGGVRIPAGTAPLTLALGAYALRLNATVSSTTSVTRRALWLDSPDDSNDVVVAEAQAGFTAAPCQG